MTPDPSREARVDRLVDERGETIVVPKDSTIGEGPRATGPIGATGPTGWWLIGLVVLAVLVGVVLLLQSSGGGAPSATPPPNVTAPN